MGARPATGMVLAVEIGRLVGWLGDLVKFLRLVSQPCQPYPPSPTRKRLSNRRSRVQNGGLGK